MATDPKKSVTPTAMSAVAKTDIERLLRWGSDSHRFKLAFIAKHFKIVEIHFQFGLKNGVILWEELGHGEF